MNHWIFKFGEVEPVGNKTMINIFNNSLRLGKLYESFFIDPPTMYHDGLTRSMNQARAEEAQRMRREEVENSRRDKCLDQRKEVGKELEER